MHLRIDNILNGLTTQELHDLRTQINNKLSRTPRKIPVTSLRKNISTRLFNCLHYGLGVTDLLELREMQISQVKGVWGVGPKVIDELHALMAKRGIVFQSHQFNMDL